MARLNRYLRHQRRGAPVHPDIETAPVKPVRTWWVVATICLLVIAVPILILNQQHSGDRLKIRRELRKF